MKSRHRRKKLTIPDIIELILEKMKNEPARKRYVGREREQRVKAALLMLKRETRKQKEFIMKVLKTRKLSFADLHGVDFYVIVMRRCYQEVIELSITGPDWVDEHIKKHPEKIVLGVKVNERIAVIKERISKILFPKILSPHDELKPI